MKIVITLDIDEFYKEEILNNVIRLDFICADKTVIERDEFNLKPMPKRIGSASEYGSDEVYIKHLINWKKEVDEILGEQE